MKLEGRNFLAEKVRIRDNHTCQICGRIWRKDQRKFDIHHLKIVNENNNTYENYKDFNEMITLCHKCHLNLDHIREKMKRNKKISEGKYSLIKQLRMEKLTLQEIANLFKVSRQRIYQILNPENKNLIKNCNNDYLLTKVEDNKPK